ncbi:unnamed protein product [Closterium sp. NIES-54]
MRVDVFALDFDKINVGIYAMYVGSASVEGDCYSCVPRAAGIEAAALGACESAAEGTASAEALHTFILDSGASRCFFCDCTIVTQLTAPVSVFLADPSGGPVIARASTVLPCPAVPSNSLLGLHIPSFSKNLVSNAVLQAELVSTFTPGGECVANCSDSRTGEHLATFTRRLGSSLYTLTTESAHVATSGQVVASVPLAASGMHSRLLVSGLPRSLPPLPRSLAPPCLPCVEGRQRAAPHSSSFLPTTAPLQTLQMDVWGPTYVRRQDPECYFLLVVDDYTRYTTVFPLRSKADVCGVLIDWIIAVCCQRRIGLVMEVARTSMIHAPAPYFLWQFADRYAVHQLSLWPRVSVLETSPTLRWTGEVGNASAFQVWGTLSLVCDTTGGKFSHRTLRCVFLGFLTDAPPRKFYHTASRSVLSPQDVTFDKSVYFYRHHLHMSSPFSPPPLFLVPVDPPPLVEPLEFSSDTFGLAEGGDPAANDTAATRRSLRLETPLGFLPRPSSPPPQLVAVDSGAAGGGDTGGADSRGDADTWGAASPSGGGFVGAPAWGSGVGQQQQSRRQETLLPQQLRVWVVRRGRVPGAWSTGAGGAKAGGTGAAGTGGARAGGAGGTRAVGTGGARAGGAGGTRVVGAGGAGSAGAGGARAGGAGGTGAAGVGGARAVGAGGTGAAGARGAGARGIGGAGAGGTRGSVAGGTGGTRCAGARVAGVTVTITTWLSTACSFSLPCTDRLPGCHEPESCPASPVRTISRAPRSRPPPVPGMHAMAIRPSSVPQRVALPSPLASPLPDVLDPESDLACAASPTVTRLLATVVSYPEFESTPAFALVTELVDFEARSRLDYVASLVTQSEFVSQRDYELHSLDFSTAFLQGSLHEEIWLRRPPGFTGSLLEGTEWSLRGPVYGLCQALCEWLDTFRTTPAALGFAPSSTDPSLFLRTDPTVPPFYILVYVNDLVFATADIEALALVKEELQKRHTCTDLGEQCNYLGLQISRDRVQRTITMTQSHMVHQVLQRFDFEFSSPQPTPLPTGHSLSAPPSDESIEPSGQYPKLVGSLITSGMGLVLGGRGSVVLTGHSDTSWADDQATQRSSHGYYFSLGSGSVSWRSTRSSFVLGSSCEAEIYAGAMTAQELRWLTYLLTDLGERPRSPPVLAWELQQRGQLRLAYVASRANIADAFTKALGSGDHQRFCTALGLVPTLPYLLVALLCLVL